MPQPPINNSIYDRVRQKLSEWRRRERWVHDPNEEDYIESLRTEDCFQRLDRALSSREKRREAAKKKRSRPTSSDAFTISPQQGLSSVINYDGMYQQMIAREARERASREQLTDEYLRRMHEQLALQDRYRELLRPHEFETPISQMLPSRQYISEAGPEDDERLNKISYTVESAEGALIQRALVSLWSGVSFCVYSYCKLEPGHGGHGVMVLRRNTNGGAYDIYDLAHKGARPSLNSCRKVHEGLSLDGVEQFVEDERFTPWTGPSLHLCLRRAWRLTVATGDVIL